MLSQSKHWSGGHQVCRTCSATLVYVMFVMYLHATDKVTIPGDITFQLDTDPVTDPPVFTLTCTSTGGPVSTVSWRRDGTILSDGSTYNITSQVTDTVTATYTHTLTVTGRLEGQYQCSVSNIRTPSGSTRSLTVVGKEWSVVHTFVREIDIHVKFTILFSHPQLLAHPPTSMQFR